MFFLTYVSTCTTWWSSRELQALLACSRMNNERAGITGMLLYKDGNFMQVLEGPHDAVQTLQIRIAADRRHQGMVTIDSGPASERQFADWSMGFSDLGAGTHPTPAGFSRFLDTPLTDPLFLDHPTPSRQMLQMFRALG